MKVIENGADRAAEAHIYVNGRVHALEEYGQYIDAHDRAICCYVAVEEGHKLRVDGRFSGMTLVVAYDVLVDGVCRKANSYVGKFVQVQKKKLDFESFLYQTPDGVIDTEILVAPYSGRVGLNKEAQEAIGTLELRVYITRQFDVEHEIDVACKYDQVTEGADTSTRVATYKDVPPQYQMKFEKNCLTLDGSKSNREKKKVYAKRPGKEPWAIFRFHYRTEESIINAKMDLTFNAIDKAFAKQEAHALELDPVPVLLQGSKPAGKNDGENSVRTSSPPPPSMPSTPTKGSRKSQSVQPKVVVRKQNSKSVPINSNSTSDTAPITDTQAVTSIEPSTTVTNIMSTSKNLQPMSTQAKDNSSTAAPVNTTLSNGAKDSAAAATMEPCGDMSAATPKKSTKKVFKKATESADSDADMKSKASLKKAVEKPDDKKDMELSDAVPPALPVEVSDVPTKLHPVNMPSVFDSIGVPSTTVTQGPILPSTKDFIKNGTKSFTSPLKKSAAEPAAIDTTTSADLQKPIVFTTPTVLLKRAPECTPTPPPEAKRLKTDVVTPLKPTHGHHQSTTSPNPRPLSVEAQIAEERKRIEAMRKRRAEMAKQKAAIDEKLAPHKQRMVEELERLRHEAAKEEAMMADDDEDYKASAAMLAEFEDAHGGV